ncbi:MAG: 4-alpha-glucanotransferase, partial [Deltaproteobacteria bacterium]|nr:4-alpha-glucanotransferase [Deltaproteobacteria bacterium]
LAQLNTHDMFPFATYWTGKDVVLRKRVYKVPEKQFVAEKKMRMATNQFLIKTLRQLGFLSRRAKSARDGLGACLALLASSPAKRVLLDLDNLMLTTEPQNMPGTTKEHPNWQRKNKWPFSQIQKSRTIAELLRQLDRNRKVGSS